MPRRSQVAIGDRDIEGLFVGLVEIDGVVSNRFYTDP
jgi:hypothetical protein